MFAGTMGKSPISRLSAVCPSMITFVVYENKIMSHGDASVMPQTLSSAIVVVPANIFSE